MKKALKFFLFSTLMLICSLVNAQSNSDFQGTWTGVDKAGNTIELQLNTTMTCILKINGSPAYNISAYRIYDGKTVAGPDALGQSRGIKFYTNGGAAVTATSNALISNTSEIVTYDGNLTMTKTGSVNSMLLSFSVSPSAPLLECELTK